MSRLSAYYGTDGWRNQAYMSMAVLQSVLDYYEASFPFLFSLMFPSLATKIMCKSFDCVSMCHINLVSEGLEQGTPL